MPYADSGSPWGSKPAARSASARSSKAASSSTRPARSSKTQAIASTPASEPSSSQFQRRRISATAVPLAGGLVLVELLELDRLLDPARRPRRPEPRRLPPLAQPPHRVQLDLGVEHGDEGVEVALVEGADELSNRIDHVSIDAKLPGKR